VWANAVRNIIVHNASRVDKMFLERCPDSGYSLGDKVALDHIDCAEIVWLANVYVYRDEPLQVEVGLRPMQCSQNSVNKFRDSFNAMFPDASALNSLLN